jgi:hypothetical protein
LDANQAVSFFACTLGWLEDGIVQSISLDNDKTHEKLVIKANDSNPDNPSPDYFVTISRYPMGATEEWIKEMWKIVDDALWIYKQEKRIQVDLTCEH